MSLEQQPRSVMVKRLPVPLLGVEVTPLTAEELLIEMSRSRELDRPFLVAGHNLHSTYLFHTDAEFRVFYETCDVVLIDGNPLLRLAQIRSKDLRPSHRIGSTDWIEAACAQFERVAIVGASARSNTEAIRRLRLAAPACTLIGFDGESWDETQLEIVAKSLERWQPSLVLIALGMPLQESVAKSLAARGLDAVIATVGGAVDQISGEQNLAPRWLGKIGLEWLWRLALSPRRLSHRYLIEPVKLLILLSRASR